VKPFGALRAGGLVPAAPRPGNLGLTSGGEVPPQAQPESRPRTVYREQSSHRFEQLCRLSGLSNTALAAALRQRLGRGTLTRQTLSGWRSGEQPVPAEAFAAAIELAGPDGLDVILREFEEDLAPHHARNPGRRSGQR